MNKETINELERLDKEQLDKVLDYAYLLDEHLYFKRETRKLSKEKKELIKYLEDKIKELKSEIFANSITAEDIELILLKTKLNTYQEILDKVRGE